MLRRYWYKKFETTLSAGKLRESSYLCVLFRFVMRPLIFLLLLFIYGQSSHGQNLVPNSGFEDLGVLLCYPAYPADFNRGMPSWTTPTTGSPDVISMRVNKSCKTHPYNHTNSLVPHNGKSMVGLSVYTNKESREYLQCQLKEPLEIGAKYEVSLWMARQYSATVATGSFGAHFSSKPPLRKDTSTLYFQPTVQFDRSIESYSLWVEVKTEFTAIEAAQFLTLGNFQNNANTPTKSTRKGNYDWGYVYIDDISLIKLAAAPPDMPILPEMVNVYFDLWSDEVPDTAYTALENFFEKMIQNPATKLEITGHTDIQGTDIQNDKLALQRAQAVARWFEEKGISNTRIECTGMGSKSPAYENTTDLGRQLNRRVEVVLIYL